MPITLRKPVRGVIRPTTNVSRRVLDLLEWMNKRYICMFCLQDPEHEPGCEFFRLLSDLRAKMQ